MEWGGGVLLINGSTFAAKEGASPRDPLKMAIKLSVSVSVFGAGLRQKLVSSKVEMGVAHWKLIIFTIFIEILNNWLIRGCYNHHNE